VILEPSYQPVTRSDFMAADSKSIIFRHRLIRVDEDAIALETCSNSSFSTLKPEAQHSSWTRFAKEQRQLFSHDWDINKKANANLSVCYKIAAFQNMCLENWVRF
jgi:hypothetical protein